MGSKKISSLFDLACLKSSMKLDLWMSQKNTCCDISSFASAKNLKVVCIFQPISDGGGVFGAVGGVPVVFGSGPNTGLLFSPLLGETKNALLKVE
ncbi:hypothetical protein P8452_41948 [Trifolium repens]|nr:hypothetical protein P8452_41948 [Trifolium repens]